ncbi:porin PorA family protein [Aeromicrobium sp.]|uniref:porin PorA family protein n=1 Tax=Aeromicrobium sp. TaxID=1871063 RepID=UPI0030BB26F7
MARRFSVVLGVAGAALIVGAAAVEYVLAPELTKFPDDTNIKLAYARTASLLNAEALQAGDMQEIFLQDVPITIQRRIKVEKATGDTAAVSDDQIIKGEQVTSPIEHTYAVDRSSLQMRSSFNDTKVEKSSGCLAIGFPLAPKANDSYTFYDPSTQKCFKADYKSSDSVRDLEVHNYTVTATGPTKDPKILANLPPVLPKQAVAGIASTLPKDLQEQLGASLDSLPDPVPMTYLSDTYIKVAADQATGFPVGQDLQLKTTMALEVDGTAVPIMPVFDVKASMTPESVKSLSNDAASTGQLIRLVDTILPLGLLILGLLLVAVAVVRERRRSGHQDGTPIT